MQRTNIGYIKMELGLYGEAEEELRQAMATASSQGLDEPLQNARRLLALALVRNWPNKLADAIQMERQAQAWFEDHGNHATVAWIQVVISGLLLIKGDYEAAEKIARSAQAVPYTKIAATAMLSRIQLADGRTAEALDTAARAVSMYQSPGRSEEDMALVYLAHAEALRESGQSERAAHVVREAYDALRVRSRKIGHADWRKSFLTAIPDHVRIAELHRELSV